MFSDPFFFTMTFRMTGRTLRPFVRFVPREQVARWFSALPWLSNFVFLCDGILLVSEYQSKQYHVAQIRSSCHGKRAGPVLVRSSPNFSYYALVLKKGKTKKIYVHAISKGVARSNDKSRSHKYHRTAIKVPRSIACSVHEMSPKRILKVIHTQEYFTLKFHTR